MEPTPLRYNISSWYQATQCLSNNSSHLHIVVSDFVQNDALEGLRIAVEHDTLGVLFSYVLADSGDIISRIDVSYLLTTQQILQQLSLYGFLITFNQKAYLPGDQLQFLMTLQGLHFDKLRLLPVLDPATRTGKTLIVAFKIADHPEWLDNTATAYLSEFKQATATGTAFNISTISESERYRWDWLDYVADIDDILRDNA